MLSKFRFSIDWHILAPTLITIVWLAAIQPPLYTSNQNTYYAHGIALVRPDVLIGDWFVTTRPPHALFTILVALLEQSGILAVGSFVIELLLGALYYASLFWIGRWLLSVFVPKSSQFSTRIVLAMIVVVFAMPSLGGSMACLIIGARDLCTNSGAVLNVYGYAEQPLYAGYLQPSEFGVFLLVSVVALISQRWKTAILSCAFAAMMHTSYFIHAAFLAGVAISWLWYQGQRALGIRLTALFVAFTLPSLLYAFSFVGASYMNEASSIIAFIRQPHHAVPAVWWGLDDILKTVVMLAAASIVVLRFSGLFRVFVVAAFGFSVLGIIVTHALQSPSVGLLYLWRGSAYLYPICLLVCLCCFYAFVIKRYPRRILWLFAALLFLFSISSTIFELQARLYATSTLVDGTLIQSVRSESEPGDIFLIPEDWGWFRLETLQAVYVDFKNHPYAAAEVLEWWRRVELSRAFYAADDVERTEFCRQEGITHYVDFDAAGAPVLRTCMIQ